MNKNNIFVDTNVLIGAFVPGKRFQAEKNTLHCQLLRVFAA